MVQKIADKTPASTVIRQHEKRAAEKKDRTWLREIVGWGVFLGILFLFFAVQNYFNGILTGLANQVFLAMSVVLEIGLIWFWDRFWY